MLSKLSHTKNFFLVLTPLLASFTVANSTSLAATFASSQSEFELKNFSHSPLSVETLTDTQTQTTATSGQVYANANAEANFISFFDNPANTKADNFSFSIVEGEGREYVGTADSFAGVIGYNFIVDPGEFSFSFDGLLNLRTEIDDRQSETANAYGDISFRLFNSLTGEEIDYFQLYGGLNTPNEDYYPNLKYSGNVTFHEATFITNFDDQNEYVTALVKGTYSRNFASLTHLTLVEVKTNSVKVKAPEPSATLSLLLFSILAVSYSAKTKLTKSKAKINSTIC